MKEYVMPMDEPQNFADRLCKAVLEKKSQVCVGLDPRLESMPEPLLTAAADASGGSCGNREAAAVIEDFCAAIIGAVSPHAVAVKLQLACFEAYGPPGIHAFKHSCRLATESGMIAIADAKRGDIGISARSYSAAFIGRPQGLDGELTGFGADAITVNPFFGSDGVQPFIDDCRAFGKGLFVLVRTSNPGAAELQELQLAEGGNLSDHISGMVNDWGAAVVGEAGYSSIGAVVGATTGQAVGRYRQLMPQAILLLPGFGAQGAGVSDVAPAFGKDGLGALVTASRSIIYAGNDASFADAAADAAGMMRDDIWKASNEG